MANILKSECLICCDKFYYWKFRSHYECRHNIFCDNCSSQIKICSLCRSAKRCEMNISKNEKVLIFFDIIFQRLMFALLSFAMIGNSLKYFEITPDKIPIPIIRIVAIIYFTIMFLFAITAIIKTICIIIIIISFMIKNIYFHARENIYFCN